MCDLVLTPVLHDIMLICEEEGGATLTDGSPFQQQNTTAQSVIKKLKYVSMQSLVPM